MVISYKELQKILLKIEKDYLDTAKTAINHREKKFSTIAYFAAKKIRKKIADELINKYKKL